MSQKTVWTNKSILSWTSQYFSNRNITSPRLNAEVLLSKATGLDRVRLYTDWERPVQSDELSRFKEFVKRRATYEPLQHITGYQDFWTLHLEVNRNVLIPRADSESVIEAVLEFYNDKKPLVILDLCTGSGNLALAIAAEFKKARVIGTDISPAALKLAKRNATINGLEDRVTFEQGDLLKGLCFDFFDFIISNPPYIPTSHIDILNNEVKLYEPKTALDGGEDGLIFYRRILRESPNYLKNNGMLFLEIGAYQGEQVLEILHENKFYNCGLRKDYTQNDRVVFGWCK